MPNCAPSSSHDLLPLGIECAAACNGTTFSVDHVNSRAGESGGCQFDWQVTRHGPHHKVFGNEELLACGSTKEIVLHCDPAKNCPRFRLVLGCGDLDGQGGGDA